MNSLKLLIIAVALLLLWVATGHTAPRLTIPESSFDFGFVPQNAVVSHVFWLHSNGDDTLRILNVKPG